MPFRPLLPFLPSTIYRPTLMPLFHQYLKLPSLLLKLTNPTISQPPHRLLKSITNSNIITEHQAVKYGTEFSCRLIQYTVCLLYAYDMLDTCLFKDAADVSTKTCGNKNDFGEGFCFREVDFQLGFCNVDSTAIFILEN